MIDRHGPRSRRRAVCIVPLAALVALAAMGVLTAAAPGRPAAAQAPEGAPHRVHLPLLARDAARTDLPAAATAPPRSTAAPTVAASPPAPASPTAAPPAATPDGGPRGAPLVVADTDRERWVFEPFPDAFCGRGTPTGLGLNFTAQSRDVLIYFEGGGACWDPLTCLLLQTAANLDGVNKAKFDAAVEQGLLGRGIFDRADPANPYRAMNWIYVPYCTGDAHLGARDAVYQGQTIRHVGWRNVEAFLARIVPTFADSGRIVVTGFSAGGLGSTGHAWQVAEAFKAVSDTAPELVGDAGPILRPPHLTAAAQRKLHDAWGLAGTIEQACPTCRPDTGYHEAYAFLARSVPGFRGSLISSYEDQTIRSFYGLLNGGNLDGPAMRRGLDDLADWTQGWDPTAIPGRFRVFFYPGNRHGALTTGPLGATPGLSDFLNAQLGGDVGWKSVRP